MIADEENTGAPSHPYVSIVVPTRNRPAFLQDCVESLLRQDYPPQGYELLVVDDGAKNETRGIIEHFQTREAPRVAYLRGDGKGPNAARNTGIASASGDPVCLLDDDVEVPSGWLRAMIGGALRHPEAGAFGGTIHLRFEGNAPHFCGREPLVGEAEFDLGGVERDVPEVVSANMAIRKWAFEKVGPFNESLPIYGDELEWEKRLTRAGYSIVYIPSAVVWHRRSAKDLEMSSLVKKYFRKGMSHVAYSHAVNEPIRMHGVLLKMASYLAHAGRRRCAMGSLMAVKQVGILWALLANKSRSRSRS